MSLAILTCQVPTTYNSTNARNGEFFYTDTQFRRRDERFQSRMKERKFEGMFRKEQFRYDSKEDCYFCPGKKRLKRTGKPAPYRQGEANIYKSSQADCTRCTLRDRCITQKAKHKKILQPLHDGINYCELMRSKIDLDASREIYSQRMRIVEPVFGNITFQKRLNYLTLRGHKKVNIQWKLYSVMHNIEKYARYGEDN